MRKPATVLLFSLLSTVPAFAQSRTLLAAGGSPEWSTGINTLSEGWELRRPFHDVTISAWLNNGGGGGAGSAYLMRRIGPGTTRADEEAFVSFELPLGFNGKYTLFEGLDLPAGVYWLVFAKPAGGPFSYANWATSTPQDMQIDVNVRYLGMAWAGSEDRIDEYMPATDFDVFTDQFPYQLEVTGTPAWIRRER
jgi:hypothetical protein